ncbi:MAG: ABC-ATPase domain-containing protein [Microcoleus sp.]
MTNQENLRRYLLQLDNRNYKAYKDIQGSYDFAEFTLIIDCVQGDPFASPSKFRVQVPPHIARFPSELFSSRSREIALRDYLTRQFDRAASNISSKRGSGKSGAICVTRCGQEVLARTSAFIIPSTLDRSHKKFIASPTPSDTEADKLGGVELRFTVGLPAGGRTILGRQAAEMLCEDIPEIVRKALKYANLNAAECLRHVETVEDAEWLRQQLAARGLVAFVADGSILPRRSGVDDRPLLKDAVSFQSPPSLKVEFDCPNHGLISGMGIQAGITLIVGGGYHGKSTLLRAIELGIYNRIPDDGREFVITNPAAVKIRAEDGRSVVGVDISPFINHLPQGRDTVQFSTENASGSTSQAANIIEALEVGIGKQAGGMHDTSDRELLPDSEEIRHQDEARTNVKTRQFIDNNFEANSVPILLIDEDTAATNFMIRDRRMQELIAKEKEPITPFIDKVKQLYVDWQVSTILVMGGSGDYFDVADTVIAMDNFQAYDMTKAAKEIATKYSIARNPEGGKHFGEISQRVPIPASLDPSRGRRDVRVKVRDIDEMAFGTEEIDLAAVEQIADKGQLRSIAAAMVYAKQQHTDGKRTLSEIIDRVMADIEDEGMDILSPFPEGDFAMFRRFELAAAINRLRSLSVKKLNS